MSRRACRVAVGASVVLLAALAYRRVFGYELLGWDSFPLVLAARVEGLGDLLGTFTEELMEGRYPLGRFWRPVLNLSIALDHALWGLAPLGYHVTDFLILLLNGGGVYVLTRRLFGAASDRPEGRGFRGVAAALAATLVFLLHPVQFEVLPVTARRADALAILFTICALLSVRCPDRDTEATPAGWTADLWTGLWVFCAVGAKETGAVAAVCVVAWAGLMGEWPLAPGRVARLARLSLVAFGALGLHVLGRVLVLDGLGGHAESSLIGGLLGAPGLALELGRALVLPQPLGSGAMQSTYLVIAGVLLLLVLLGLLRGTRALRGSVFLLVWGAALLVVHGMSGEVRAWYAAPLLAVFALGCGLLVQLAIDGRARSAWLRAPALLLIGMGALPWLAYSGLAHHYDQWTKLSTAESRFFDEFATRVRGKRVGQVVLVRGLPLELDYPEDVPQIESAVGMSDYSAQAWAELAFPDLPLRVVGSLGQRPAPNPNRIVVGVVPMSPRGEP